MAPPRNIRHIKSAQQKNASAQLRMMRNIYGAIQSPQHTIYCTSPIHITQNIYQSPQQIPPIPFFEQFYKHIPPPPFYINNTPSNRPSNTNNHTPNNTPINADAQPPLKEDARPPPKIRDYSEWKDDDNTSKYKTKSVGIRPQRPTTSKPVLGRSVITTDNVFQDKPKIILPSHITKKVIKTTVSPAPPVPRYDIPGEVEMTVAMNTRNTPVTTCAAKPLKHKRREKIIEKTKENEKKHNDSREIRTVILSEDYDLELHCNYDF